LIHCRAGRNLIVVAGGSDNPPVADTRAQLKADCDRCIGLCCVAPTFLASADFAISKPAGQACPNLGADHRCTIHSELRQSGFRGCTVFDCFGAGQQITQVTFKGNHWRDGKAVATEMFAVFEVMRQLYESLWYLTEARTLLGTDRPAAPEPATGLIDRVNDARQRVEQLTECGTNDLRALEPVAFRREIGALLGQVSEFVRGPDATSANDHRNADLIEAKFRGADLRAANLRGAYLIGADLRNADLRMADLLGADLRATDLGNADLSTAIFVTQPQIEAAHGDNRTRIPPILARPNHWLR
jgi:uncharacterized protein YjbI with pentapeptide repeats